MLNTKCCLSFLFSAVPWSPDDHPSDHVLWSQDGLVCCSVEISLGAKRRPWEGKLQVLQLELEAEAALAPSPCSCCSENWLIRLGHLFSLLWQAVPLLGWPTFPTHEDGWPDELVVTFQGSDIQNLDIIWYLHHRCLVPTRHWCSFSYHQAQRAGQNGRGDEDKCLLLTGPSGTRDAELWSALLRGALRSVLSCGRVSQGASALGRSLSLQGVVTLPSFPTC